MSCGISKKERKKGGVSFPGGIAKTETIGTLGNGLSGEMQKWLVAKQLGGETLPGSDEACASDRTAHDQAGADERLFPVAFEAVVEEGFGFSFALGPEVEGCKVGAAVGSGAVGWAGISF